MPTLARIGLCELALGAVLGWLVALSVSDNARVWLARLRISSPRRLVQCHIDYLMMGLILIAVGLVAPDLPGFWQGALVFGSVANPALFLVLAFGESWSKRLSYRGAALVSFTAMSSALVAAAAIG